MLLTPEASPGCRGRRRPNFAADRKARLSTPDFDESVQPVIQNKDKKPEKKEKGFLSAGSRTKIRKALQRINFKPKSTSK